MSALRVSGGGEGAASKPRVEYGGGGGRGSPAPAHAVNQVFSFDDALEASEIEDLLDQLYDVSARLSSYPSTSLLAEYRSLLGELLSRAMQGFRIRRDMRWRSSDRRMYVTIERARQAMDELEDAFLYEGDRTKALSLMEEIKGCLISLLM